MQYLTTATLAAQAVRDYLDRLGDEHGEGVISTAIAVLIMAFVGAAMWLGFSALTDSTCDSVARQLMSMFTGSTISCDG